MVWVDNSEAKYGMKIPGQVLKKERGHPIDLMIEFRPKGTYRGQQIRVPRQFGDMDVFCEIEAEPEVTLQVRSILGRFADEG